MEEKRQRRKNYGEEVNGGVRHIVSMAMCAKEKKKRRKRMN